MDYAILSTVIRLNSSIASFANSGLYPIQHSQELAPLNTARKQIIELGNARLVLKSMSKVWMEYAKTKDAVNNLVTLAVSEQRNILSYKTISAW